MSTKRKRSTGSLFTTPAVEAPSPTPFFSSPVLLPNFFAQSKGYDPQSPHKPCTVERGNAIAMADPKSLRSTHQQFKNSSRRKEHIHTLLHYPHIRKSKIYHKMRQRKGQRYILSGSYRKLLNYKSNTAHRLRCRNKRW
ncbi:hypothetical protein KCU91_g5102, partial [Aureobasidium melanogenum]